MTELLGNSPGITGVRDKVERLLQRRPDSQRLPTILIQGETGTGKGLLARELHRAGPRGDGPFVHVNCAAIPDSLLEAELFGFERGAFTDARQAKPGLFQAANRGTIFLDEVGLLPPPLQSKLLTVVEDRAVRRLGATRSEHVDVWIVSATSEDLEADVRARRFREDLYHRLALVPLRLPPLRERGDDVLLLAERLLARACADYGVTPRRIADDARAALLGYAWPGNVRELANVMERVALLGDGVTVTAATLELPATASRSPAPPSEARPLREAVAGLERDRLLAVLQETRWNLTWAAEKLGVPRNTLRYRIARLGLEPETPLGPLRQRAKGARRPTPSEPRVAAATDVRWERRHVALLRVMLDASDAALETTRQLETVLDKARLFGAQIQELGASVVVAAFGIEPVEDAPRRAAHTAMAIRRAAARGGARVWLAIHVAPLMLARVGDSVSIAAEDRGHAWAALDELLARAAPGEALVSTAAAAFLARRFALSPVDPAAFRLPERELSDLGPDTRIAGFEGRREEIELLRARLGAARAGQGQVVGIVGEAGIGKSRVLVEMRPALAGDGLTVFDAPCQSYAATIPYFPFVAVLRARCGIAETDPPDVAGAKVRAVLGDLGMDARTATPYLLRVLGVREDADPLAELSPVTIQSRTFELLRQLCLRDARRRPLVLVVEDAHWIDRTSESFVASLASTLAAAPILLVATYRPGYRPPWMEQSYATQIALSPLSAEEGRRLVEAVLGAAGGAPALVEAILARAEGNPFFLEELARSVREQGQMREAPPETVEAVLAARIGRVSEPTRAVLETAAVIGREMPARVLAAVSEAGSDLESHLGELTRLEFLHARGGTDDVLYVFKHTLTQEVAYAGVPAPRRRALHSAVARALERLHPDRAEELCEVLAYHYRQASEAEKAVEYLDLANRKAERASAMVEAKARFDEALVLLESMPDTAATRERRVRLLVNQVLVMTLLFRFEEYQALLTRYETIAAGLGRPALLGAFYARLGMCQWAFGDYARAVETLARGAALCESAGSDDDAAQAYVVWQWSRLYTGDFDDVLRLERRVADLMKRRFNVRWHVYALTASARALAYLGRWTEALDHATRALVAGEESSDGSLMSQAALTAGLVLCSKGDVAAAREYGELALGKAPTPADQVWARAILAWIWCRSGDAARGVPVLASVVASSRAARWRAAEFYAVWLGEGQAMLGAAADAEATLHACLETADAHGMRYVVGCAERLLGELVAARDPAAATARLERSITVLGELGAENDLALAHAAYGRLLGSGAHVEQARASLGRALEIFERLGTLGEPERVRAALAALAGGGAA